MGFACAVLPHGGAVLGTGLEGPKAAFAASLRVREEPVAGADTVQVKVPVLLRMRHMVGGVVEDAVDIAAGVELGRVAAGPYRSSLQRPGLSMHVMVSTGTVRMADGEEVDYSHQGFAGYRPWTVSLLAFDRSTSPL